MFDTSARNKGFARKVNNPAFDAGMVFVFFSWVVSVLKKWLHIATEFKEATTKAFVSTYLVVLFEKTVAYYDATEGNGNQGLCFVLTGCRFDKDGCVLRQNLRK